MSENEKMRLHRKRVFRDKVTPYLFMSPAYICMIVLLLLPVFLSVYLSFTDAKLLTMFDANWVGLKNYRTFFNSNALSKVFKSTLSLVILVPILAYIIGMFFALMMQKCRFLSPLIRGLIVLPIAVSDVALVLVVKNMLNADYGVINAILVKLGLTQFSGFSWTSTMPAALITVILFCAWKNYPICFLMLFAGMKAIPGELYDAASVDGANSIQKFFHVTMPGLRFVTASLFLLEIVWQINQFTIIWLMTMGGPADATSVLSIFSYRNAFMYDKLGYGAAIGFFTMIIALIAAGIYYKVVISGMDSD